MKLYKIKVTDNCFTFRGEKILNEEFWAIKTLNSYLIWNAYTCAWLDCQNATVLEERTIDDHAPITTNTPSESSLLSSLGSKPSKITIEF